MLLSSQQLVILIRKEAIDAVISVTRKIGRDEYDLRRPPLIDRRDRLINILYADWAALGPQICGPGTTNMQTWAPKNIFELIMYLRQWPNTTDLISRIIELYAVMKYLSTLEMSVTGTIVYHVSPI